MPPDYPFSVDAFRSRVEERFESRADILEAVGGDHLLNPDYAEALNERTFKRAAVLMPVIDRDGEASVLMTQRTAHLSAHSGQIAFPGGKIDPGETPEQAALREAHEEVGLDPDYVDVIGTFGDYFSGSGFQVAPVVGLVKDGFSLTRNEAEVAHIFEVPLSFLMTADNHSLETWTFNGKERHLYAMPWRDETLDPPAEWRIWGLTAGIIAMVQDRLYGGAT